VTAVITANIYVLVVLYFTTSPFLLTLFALSQFL